ncbi:MAG TPA: GH92 family glycosyl hydrolase, partial [Flavisolibacter sp.]
RDWNFEAVKKQARAAWNRELGKISVRGGTHDQRVVFYTALYHTMIAPNLFQDVDGRYRGTDGKTHEASGFRNYTVFSLWDTYRALHPLMNMIDRKRSADWIRTFLAQYKNGGMLPVWELAGNETFCMIGYHSVPVILDAWVKGIRNFDTTLALEAMRSYAESDRFGLDQYRQRGYISNNHEHESVSKTLEYAYDDWCIAQFARLTGHDSVARHYLRRAQYYMNVFDPSTGHMRGKTDARWYHPFEAREINNFFTEGNSWQYTFAVPHDVQTLITLHGGPGKFVGKLDELFTTTSQTTGREQPDVTGLIGQYAHGNEPSHHMAYLFNYAGMPWRTQELVHRICNEFYKNAPDGLIGNEDCGQMSAWYVFSAMGFYPVCPGNGDYIIGTPVFDEVTIHLENGKHVRISANREARDHHYVRSVILNGKPHQRNWLRHADLANGAEIRFDLVSSPVRTWGADAAALPMSKISGPSIVPVPFADVPSEKFRNTIEVPLKTIDSNARIVYSIDDSLFNDPVTYSTPVRIDRSATLYMHAVNGLDRSHTVQQYFHRIPNNYSIRVLSTVHPMYTAGGHDVLVDGLVGNSNWRSGGWQSYFDQDFEAVVDLGKDTVVSEVGIHVLQDVSPWIVYPKEVVFYTSTDGITFSEAGRAINEKANDDKMVQTQVLAIRKTMHARYLKVRAVSGGKLPAWHESAGSPSHLFIDEIVIR